MKGAKFDFLDEKKLNVLHRALQKKNPDLKFLQFLVEKGMKITDEFTRVGTIFEIACKNGNITVEILQYLLEQGLDIKNGEKMKRQSLSFLTFKYL